MRIRFERKRKLLYGTLLTRENTPDMVYLNDVIDKCCVSINDGTFTYKELPDGFLDITFVHTVPDSRQEGWTVDIAVRQADVPPEQPSLFHALHVLRSMAVRTYCHELDEWFMYDKERYFDPHKDKT